MDVAVRVDASKEIGVGHFMRCLTLANALANKGARVRIVSVQAPDHLRRMAGDRGFEFSLLTPAVDGSARDDLQHSHWLCSSQASDADATVRALADRTWDWLVVDQYALDARWEGALYAAARRILVIDDLGDRAHDCDVLVDQNLYADMETRYLDRVPARCALLLGPGHALLREPFVRLHASAHVRSGSVRHLLVLLGGMDAHNDTAKAIQAITRLPPPSRPREVDVVIGAEHPARRDVESLSDRHGYRYHVQPPDVAELMAQADLAIGASGSTSWERCCLGVPTLCLTRAANQVAIAEGLAAAGAVVNLGDGAALSVDDLTCALRQLIAAPTVLASMSRTAHGLVDGLGIERVVARMVSTT